MSNIEGAGGMLTGNKIVLQFDAESVRIDAVVIDQEAAELVILLLESLKGRVKKEARDEAKNENPHAQ